MSMYGVEMLLGVIIGAATGLLFALLILKFTKTDGRLKCKYDERQRNARGTAYKYSYFTAIIGCTIYAMLISTIGLPVDAGLGILLVVLLSIVVHFSYSIWHDAYFSLNENRKRLLVCCGVIGVINLLLGIMRVADGSGYADGKLKFESMNLFCGLMFLVLFVVLLLKSCADRTEDEE